MGGGDAGNEGQPGKELGKPLGSADGKPAGSGKTLGNGGNTLGRDVGNTNGAGPASASAEVAGRFEGTGRAADDTARVVESVGTWLGPAAVVTSGAGVAGGSVARLVAAGADTGSVGDELEASVPVPTRIPTTLAPRSKESPISAASGTRRRRRESWFGADVMTGIPTPA